MGLFGFGGVGHKSEENQIRQAMSNIGAYEGDHLEKCERCNQYMRPSETGSKYYGGCRLYGIKVFSNYKCSNFSR